MRFSRSIGAAASDCLCLSEFILWKSVFGAEVRAGLSIVTHALRGLKGLSLLSARGEG